MPNRTIPVAPTGARTRACTTPRIRGYAVGIDFIEGRPHDARLVDQSPVLFIEKVGSAGFADDGNRRMCAVEFNGEGRPPESGLQRHVVDAFFVDRRVAEFVWQAVIEKIENDAASTATA
ncbi:hypothetical protein HNR59_002896 [Aquamicrobium lusatiense]|uniref:Uncharacterized protein n=1 Tax=Aquamicrobium lusatiense TaxID=89772 RepID=A0A7W9S3P6_9HYPH|nr:hypothetical protein [Aquamicrobium lusatiense]MBB6013507.1 hypothetical protein [Aquamicrobium lusatiense]